jgi:hypothetical protein
LIDHSESQLDDKIEEDDDEQEYIEAHLQRQYSNIEEYDQNDILNFQDEENEYMDGEIEED